MLKFIHLAILAVFLTPWAEASSGCLVTLVGATAGSDAITVTFRNVGKLPVRRLEFNCTLIHAQAHKAQSFLCHEENALFFPGTEYTVSYTYPRGFPQPVVVSLKSATLSDGYTWKPSPRQRCRVLTIYPRKSKIVP